MARKKISDKTKKEVFFNLKKISDLPSDVQKRYDYKGRIICYTNYGDRSSKFGWNIDHINRNTLDNNTSNLRAIHFETHEELNLKFNKGFKG